MTTATLTTSEPETAQVERRVRSEPRPFDFRRQTKLSREHIRTLQIVQETFCRGFSTMLASSLRTVAHVSIRSIEQHSYDEYVRELPNPTLLTLLGLAPLPGAAILQLPTDIAYCAVELLLGGKGSGEQPTRPFTDLELLLLRTRHRAGAPGAPLRLRAGRCHRAEGDEPGVEPAVRADRGADRHRDRRVVRHPGRGDLGRGHDVHPVLEPAVASRRPVGDVAVRITVGRWRRAEPPAALRAPRRGAGRGRRPLPPARDAGPGDLQPRRRRRDPAQPPGRRAAHARGRRRSDVLRPHRAAQSPPRGARRGPRRPGGADRASDPRSALPYLPDKYRFGRTVDLAGPRVHPGARTRSRRDR